MQIPGHTGYLQALPRGRVALRGLGQASSNPYPNGVPVSGSGSSKPWPTAYMPQLGVWVANTGFGIAPIFTFGQFGSLWDIVKGAPALKGTGATHLFNIVSAHDLTNPDTGQVDTSAVVDMGIVGTDPNAAMAGPQELYADPQVLTIYTSGGGRQVVFYRVDSQGLYVPASVAGYSASGLSLFDELIMAGAIIGAVVATAGTAAGFATGAGPGAAAVGGSVDVAAGSAAVAAPAAAVAPVAAEVPAATAPEIATFTPPAIAPPAVVDVSASVPIDITSATTSAAAAATSPLSQVFSISKYIQTLAGAYKTVAGLSSPGSHPQTGQVTRLPDGSVQRVNPNGSTTIIEPSGNQTTVGDGGSVSTQPAGAGGGLLLVLAAGALALFTS